jgi:transposase-like protein
MRRHHWLLVGAAAIFVAGWLLWNVLLVESEIPAAAVRCSPPGLDRVQDPRPGGGTMEKEFQRWTAKRKVELLLELIRGEKKLVEVCREHDLKQSEVETWMETFVAAGERGLKARSEDEQAVHEREVRELRAKVGELVLELDARKKLDALTGKPEKAF